MSAALRVYAGQGGGDALFLLFDGGTDDGANFPVVCESAPLNSEVGGEAVWPAVYLALTSAGDVVWKLTPIVDGVAYDGVSAPDETLLVTITGTGGRVTSEHLLPTTRGLYDPVDPTTELARFFQRGKRFALRLEIVGAAPDADVILEKVEVEVEPVDSSLQPEAQ